MKRILSGIVFVQITAMLVLVGCGVRPTTPEPDGPAQAFTSAAETIVAQLTDLALTMHPPSTPVNATPIPPATTVVDNTPTMVVETPSEEITPGNETGDETPTETITPVMPTSTLEPPEMDPLQRLGNPDFRDRFENAGNWSVYNDGLVSFSIQDNELLMRAFNPVSWDGWMVSRPVLEDFYIEMTGSFRACSGLDRYGLLVRASRPESGFVGYLLGITCDGRYSLREWNGATFTPLIDWTTSEYLMSGANEVNRLGLWAEGNRLVVYANGYQLEEARDSRYSSGRFGVFVGSVNTSGLTVEVDEVAYWILP